jgi:hypothetical protein
MAICGGMNSRLALFWLQCDVWRNVELFGTYEIMPRLLLFSLDCVCGLWLVW